MKMWNVERQRVDRLSDVEDIRVTCPKGHLEPRGAFRVLRGAPVTVPAHPCTRCVSIDERRATKAAGAPAKKRPTAEERIADRAAKAGAHLARVAEKDARRVEAMKARQAREDRRAQERVKAAERRAKADRLARKLLKLWESGELPADLKAIVEAA